MIRVYTDGSWYGKGPKNPGGWAFAISKDEYRSGHVATGATNQRMELQAVIEAIQHINWTYPKEELMVIVTDSAYVMNCFNHRWWKGWSDKGVKLKDDQPVMNWDQWELLIGLVTRPLRGRVKFEKVKAHSGDDMNDFVDQLAKDAAQGKEQHAVANRS